MTRLFLQVLRAFTMGGLIAWGASAAQCECSITEDEALKAEDARYAAQIGNDFATMARLFADDLVYAHSSGVVDGKESYIERRRTRALRCRAMRRSDAKACVYGCVAIITGAGDFDGTANGKDSAVSPLIHCIWGKTDSGVLLGVYVSPDQAVAPALFRQGDARAKEKGGSAHEGGCPDGPASRSLSVDESPSTSRPA